MRLVDSPSSARWMLLGAIVAVAIAVTAALNPIPQPVWYHDFADSTEKLGVSNALNVLSNLAFVIVGLAGLLATLRSKLQTLLQRWSLAVLFIGLILTGFGSGYYHLAPDNQRLLWDRLPMTIAMAGILSLLLMNHMKSQRWWILPILLLIGAGSVLQWAHSEAEGRGDLRWYALYEGLIIISGVVLLSMRPLWREGTKAVVIALGANVAAKVFELLDRPILTLGHAVSGHTLKHLSAGLGFVPLVVWLWREGATSEDRKKAAVGARN